ncbi:hypothetical protein GGI35DRAFT_476468 [Trichoderma velutinum]
MASTNARRRLQPANTTPDHLLESPPPTFGIASQSGLVGFACSPAPARYGITAQAPRSQATANDQSKRNQLLRPKAALCSVYVSSAWASLQPPSSSSPHVWTRTWGADGKADPGGDTDSQRAEHTEYGLSKQGQARSGQYGPRGIDASSEHEPGPAPHEPIRGQPCLTEPHPGSDSVLQQMLAKQTLPRPGNAALRGHLLISR